MLPVAQKRFEKWWHLLSSNTRGIKHSHDDDHVDDDNDDDDINDDDDDDDDHVDDVGIMKMAMINIAHT